MRKWLVAILYVSGISIAFIYRYNILSWMKQDHNIILSIGTATLLAMFPVVPYKAIIGLYGYAYGSLSGAMICWLATNLAAAIMFGGTKYLFRHKARSYLASVPMLEKFTAAVERRPFASVVLARLAPVIPQTVVNVYAGAAGLPFWSYIAASAVGKIPGIALFAFLGGNVFQHPKSAVIAIIIYAAVLALAGWSLRPPSPDGKNHI
ncbi:TVP38/TMEM64 family protein [Paenibacillus monticola]|uniref:TVP38/TMEM64 family membrane protein n=1 Tax=Paenibacillus monticola TaxID=2666075 RepID=A0A7X2L1X9_9BACL|nr:VTT domain-containing protein [Paenibacillus monticola]MRN53620.1 TVP38/TMEM64 family protein [Paenibacillus monticola]